MSDQHAAPAAAPDAFSTLADLLALIADPQGFAARLREHKQALVDIAAGQAKLLADQMAFDAHEKMVRAELDAKTEALSDRRNKCYAAEGELEERAQRIAKLEAAWKCLGEPDEVRSGFRSPSQSPLAKAQRAAAHQRKLESNQSLDEPEVPAAEILPRPESPRPDASKAARHHLSRTAARREAL